MLKMVNIASLCHVNFYHSKKRRIKNNVHKFIQTKSKTEVPMGLEGGKEAVIVEWTQRFCWGRLHNVVSIFNATGLYTYKWLK